MTQQCLKENVLNFTAAKDWPSSSPNFNLFSYKLVDASAEDKDSPKKSLKHSLRKAMMEISVEVVYTLIND